MISLTKSIRPSFHWLFKFTKSWLMWKATNLDLITAQDQTDVFAKYALICTFFGSVGIYNILIVSLVDFWHLSIFVYCLFCFSFQIFVRFFISADIAAGVALRLGNLDTNSIIGLVVLAARIVVLLLVNVFGSLLPREFIVSIQFARFLWSFVLEEIVITIIPVWTLFELIPSRNSLSVWHLLRTLTASLMWRERLAIQIILLSDIIFNSGLIQQRQLAGRFIDMWISFWFSRFHRGSV